MISVWPSANTSSMDALMRMNSHIQSSKPPTAARALACSRAVAAAPRLGVDGRSIVVAISSLRSQQVQDLLAHDRGDHDRRDEEDRRRRATDRLDVTGQARKKSIKVIFMPLIEWKSTASTRPNSSTWTARFLYASVTRS